MPSFRAARPSILLAVALLSAGCTADGQLKSFGLFDGLITALQPLDPQTLSPRIFEEVSTEISDVALTPLPPSQLHQIGCTALLKKAPALRLTCSRDAHAPQDEDPAAWAAETMALLTRARQESPALAALSTAQTYHLIFDAQLAALDAYSHYTSVEDKAREAAQKSAYVGIGATFEAHAPTGAFRITDIYPNSPADTAGLKRGDLVTSVNSWPSRLLTTEGFAARVRGPAATAIRLEVWRGTGAEMLTIPRAAIDPQAAYVRFLPDKRLALIRLIRFERDTAALFRTLAHQAVWLKPHAVVLDLTHNSGGDLEAAATIAGLLGGPEGTTIRTQGRVSSASASYKASGDDVLDGLPLYVLVDGKTASAAELLAGSLKERNRATLIGSTTFGKWSVQRVSPLPDGADLALTWAHFSLASGASFMGTGLAPHVCLSDSGTITTTALCLKQDYFPQESALSLIK